MPKGPIKHCPFEDYVGAPISNNGKSGDKATYDDWSGVAPGDGATSTEMGDLLTGVSISGTSNPSKVDTIY